MVGCGECGAMNKMAESVEICARVIGGVKYAGKLTALRCKKCGSVWHDPDEDMQLTRAMERVAKGVDPERANAFDVHRTQSVVPR